MISYYYSLSLISFLKGNFIKTVRGNLNVIYNNEHLSITPSWYLPA